jgi:hypothetical protein
VWKRFITRARGTGETQESVIVLTEYRELSKKTGGDARNVAGKQDTQNVAPSIPQNAIANGDALDDDE